MHDHGWPHVWPQMPACGGGRSALCTPPSPAPRHLLFIATQHARLVGEIATATQADLLDALLAKCLDWQVKECLLVYGLLVQGPQ